MAADEKTPQLVKAISLHLEALEIQTKSLRQGAMRGYWQYGLQWFQRWAERVEHFLESQVHPEEAQRFRELVRGTYLAQNEAAYNEVLEAAQASLGAIMDELSEVGLTALLAAAERRAKKRRAAEVPAPSAALMVAQVCRQFERSAAALRGRKRSRSDLLIHDEYDVQDLLHAVLRAYFDDVRPEEWTPSYAGAAARMDFLLKAERVVVEAKHTRDGLRDGGVGEELIVDIQKYKGHADCGALICLVYDPGRLLRNPRALERDLTRDHEGIAVTVIVSPPP